MKGDRRSNTRTTLTDGSDRSSAVNIVAHHGMWRRRLVICLSCFFADFLLVQLRRQTRERREYIYRKSLEAQERQTWARKQQIRQFLAEGKPIPPELRDDAKALGGNLALDEGQSGKRQNWRGYVEEAANYGLHEQSLQIPSTMNTLERDSTSPRS